MTDSAPKNPPHAPSSELVAAHLLQALAEEIVGEDGAELATMHFAQGFQFRTLAQWFHISRSALHRRLSRLWDVLEQHDAIPAGWQRQPRGGRRVLAYQVEGDIYVGKYESRRRCPTSAGHTPPTE